MNLLTVIEEGRKGKNIGLSFGIPELDRAIGGIHKKKSFAVGAEPKVGKTSFVDYAFILSPFINNPQANVEYIYFSTETERIEKEAIFCSHFIYKEYRIELGAEYILGRKIDDLGNPVIITEQQHEYVKAVYQKYIIPLFGEFNPVNGNRISKGKIDFIEERINPTGVNKYIMNHAKANGTFITEEYYIDGEKKDRIIGYKPHDESKYTFVIVDHIRGLQHERGFNKKENIDKMSEYHVKLRNTFQYIFVFVAHLNRGSADIERMKLLKSNLYPGPEQFKDSGNLAEDCSYVITMMSPGDQKYGLRMHFDTNIDAMNDEERYKYRTLHLVQARHTQCPQHFKLVFNAPVIDFKTFKNDYF